MSKSAWALLAKILRYAGLTAFAFGFIGTNVLAQYINFTRPHTPDPSRGWIAEISWSYGAYGTPQERDRVIALFNCGFYSFILIAAGEAINIYKFNDYPNRRL